MREIHRTIASALLFSSDGKLLLGKKDPNSGGVYLDCRHLPWGGVDKGESLRDAVIREVEEEVWLNISKYDIIRLPYYDKQTAIKTDKASWEKLLCHMDLNAFKVVLDQDANNINMRLNDDLIEVRRFSTEELSTIPLVPGGREFFEKIGIIKTL